MNKRSLVAAGLLSTSLLFSACGDDEGTNVSPPVGAPSSHTSTEAESNTSRSEKPGDAQYTDKYNFTATTFDGETFELAVHKGTPVVINFWESW